MSSFIHSTKVPKIYKAASLIARLVQEKGQSVKEIVFSAKYKHFNTKALYALVVETIQHLNVLDQLLSESKVIIEVPRLDPWLARVLITELLWGKKTLPPNSSKPITAILEHHDAFIGILKAAVRDGTHQNEPRQNKALLKPRYVRVNTLALSVGDAVTEFRREGWNRASPADDSYAAYLDKLSTLGEGEYAQDVHVKEVFAFPPRTEFYQHELYTSGALVLQDKATAVAAFLLDPPPGSNVLDMCSAPGIKTTQLAAIMKDKGTLYAVEKNAKRYKTMCEFVERHAATCVKTINADATTLTPQECKDVEYILVDPTCSGSGMPGAITKSYPEEDRNRVENLANFQVILLERAMTNFPKVKRVVYSTCSTFHEENEQVVEKILKIVNPNPESPNFELMKLPAVFTSRGSNEYECGPKCLLFNEEQDKTTGFFVAVFQRVGNAPLTNLSKRHKGKNKSMKPMHENQELAFAEVEENGGGDVGESRLKRKKIKKELEDELQEVGDTKMGLVKMEENGDTDVGESKKSKKKQKNKMKRELEEEDNAKIGLVKIEENSVLDQGESKKGKKKIKKVFEDELLEGDTKMGLVNEEETGEGNLVASKKRKKKRSEEKYGEHESVGELEAATKKEGLRHKRDEEEVNQLEGNEGEPSKKKKHRKKENDEVVEEFDTVKEESSKELKKKKKKRNTDREEVGEDFLEANTEGSRKKKKKKKYIIEHE